MMGMFDGGVVSDCLVAVNLLPTGGREMVATTVKTAATTSDSGDKICLTGTIIMATTILLSTEALSSCG